MNYEFWIYTIIILTMICGFIVWIFYQMAFKHFIIIREMTKDRKFIVREKGREITDDNNVTWWLLKKERDRVKKRMPVPPPEAVELTKRGKKFVEAYRTEMGEYIFVTDNAKLMDVPEDIKILSEKYPKDILRIEDEEEKKLAKEQFKQNVISVWRSENKVIAPLQPLTSNQRIALVTGIVKAEQRKMTDWKKDIPLYMALGGGILLLALVLIFAPDIIKTYTKGATQISDSLKSYETIRHDNLMTELKEWQKITEGIQTINNVQVEQNKRLEALEASNG